MRGLKICMTSFINNCILFRFTAISKTQKILQILSQDGKKYISEFKTFFLTFSCHFFKANLTIINPFFLSEQQNVIKNLIFYIKFISSEVEFKKKPRSQPGEFKVLQRNPKKSNWRNKNVCVRWLECSHVSTYFSGFARGWLLFRFADLPSHDSKLCKKILQNLVIVSRSQKL